MAKDLLTKHGKYYELNPYKIIMRLEGIKESLEEEAKELGIDRPAWKRLKGEVDDLIDQMYEQGQLPR